MSSALASRPSERTAYRSTSSSPGKKVVIGSSVSIMKNASVTCRLVSNFPPVEFRLTKMSDKIVGILGKSGSP